MTRIDTYAVRINTADDEAIKVVDVMGLLNHVPDETPVDFIDLVGDSSITSVCAAGRIPPLLKVLGLM